MKKITKISTRVKIYLFVLFLFFNVSNTYSQYLETFSVPDKGILSGSCSDNTPTSCASHDFSGVDWQINGDLSLLFSNDYVKTTPSGVLEFNDIDEEICWESPVLDISAVAGAVSISVDLTWTGHDSTEFIDVEYSIDEGAWIQIANQYGGGDNTVDFPIDNTGSGTVSINNIAAGASKLSVRVCTDFSSTAEFTTVDNVSVPEAGVTIFSSSTAPTVTTTAASSINTTEATLAGNVTADGGATVTERGIVYSETATNANPQISGTGVTKDSNGIGTGAFSESITGLSPGTQYSFNAYAINSEGTSYGAVQTFTTSALTPPTITFDNISKTYGDTNFNLAASSNSGGTITYSIEGANITGTSLSGTNNATVTLGDVGSITIRATQAADGIYASGTKDITLSITQAGLTVTADSGQTKVYGATDSTLTYTITGFVNSDTESDLDTGVSISRASGEDVGTYTITPSSAADSNYTVSFVTADFTITQAGLTVTADAGQTKVYGTSDSTLTYTITGFVNSDTESDLDTGVSISRASGEDVGTYTITPSSAADSNYTVSFVTADFTITQAGLTVTADAGQTKVYGTSDSTLTYTITGFVNSDTESDLDTGVSISRASGEDAGTYTITPSSAADSNYTVSFVTADFTITQAGLTVTADSGQMKVYGATDATLTYTITGFVNSDTESDLDTGVSISRASGEDVGTYTITPSSAADSNYTVSFVTADFTITQAGLTVTADAGQTKVYGTSDSTLTYTITGFVNSDTESDLDTGVSISRASGEDAGTYTITPSSAADSNYTVSFVTADFTITQAGLTVTADSGQMKVYGATDATLTYTITGFVNSDTESDLDTGVSISRAIGEDVGTYTITPSAAADSNYTVSFVTADFTITQAGLTVTADSGQTKVYGATDATLTYTITGFVNSDTESDLDTGVSISRAIGEDAGTYTITPSAAADSNYTVSFVTADFTITKAGLTVTADAKTKVVGEADPALTYQITSGSLVGSDTFTGTLERQAGETAGTYAILVGTLTPGTNYTVTYVGANFTITEATASVEDVLITKAITVYPNPVSETLFIELNSGFEIKKIQVYTMMGKEVQSIQGNSSSIDLMDLSKGVYFVKFITNQGIGIKKVLKK